MLSSWARLLTKGQLTSPPHTCGVSPTQPHSSGGLGGFSHTLPTQTPHDRGPSLSELDSYTEITGMPGNITF